MNDNPASLEDDLRATLALDDTIASLDPARVIAGARRRRKVRGLATAGIVVLAVAGVATGGVLAGNQLLGVEPSPAASTPPVASPTTTTPRTVRTAAPLTPASCVSALNGEPGPGSGARQRNLLRDEDGDTILIADASYWAVCDNTWGEEPSVRRPEHLQRPSTKDADAFAVAANTIGKPGSERDFYWAGGLLPAGVTAVRYTFPDGKTADAAVDGEFWLMRHMTAPAAASFPPASKIHVQLLSASGALVNDFRLTWGVQTCAQISHGC